MTRIGVVKENGPGERRVAVIERAKKGLAALTGAVRTLVG
jgi:hypothetical protein